VIRLIVALTAVLSSLAMAQDYEQVRARLQTLGNFSAEQVSIGETPVPGILEVRLGAEIVYMSDDSRYLVQGRMFDLDTREDLTDRAMDDVRAGLMSELDADQMISFGPEDADYDLFVFTDVDCGYCRKLHGEMQQYSDAGIRIHYMAFPRAGIGSETFRKMTSVWCADDPQHAMDVAKSGQTPEPVQCDAPIAEQYELGKSMGVTGTPALLTPAGDLIPGYVPPRDLRGRLASLAQAASESPASSE